MANQIAYSNKSIIDLSKDTPTKVYNTVERSGSKLKLVGKARCIYDYNFKTSGDTINSEQLQLSFSVESSNSEDYTRYNENIAIIINIQYWQEVKDSAGVVTEYTDGEIDTYKIYPYLTYESDGYFDTYEIPLKSMFIKTINIEYVNLNESTITFDNVKLKYSITVSQAVTETVGFDISLLGVDWYPNGFQVVYDGNDNTDKFYWNGDENDELNGINVNGVKLIYMRNHTEMLE